MQFKYTLAGIITAFIIGGVFVYFRAQNANQNKIQETEEPVVQGLQGGFSRNGEFSDQTAIEDVKMAKVDDFNTVTSLVSQKQGTYGIYVRNIATLKEFTYNSHENFYGASLYKILVAGATYDLIYRDKLSPNYVYTYKNSDYEGGSGVLQTQKEGTSYTIDELLTYLLKDSDNIAQNILERNITWEAVDTFYKSHVQTPQNFSETFYTTPSEIAEIFMSIYEDPNLPKEAKQQLFTTMTETSFEDRIASTLEPSLIFSHKIGNAPVKGTWHDCGVVFSGDFTNPVVVCLMSKNTTFSEFLQVSSSLGKFINSLY